MSHTQSKTKKLYTAEQVRQLDQLLALARGVPTWQLMQDAGTAAAKVLKANWPEAKRIIIMAGSGNNAGDGWVLASLLHADGFDVFVIALKAPDQLQGDAARAAQMAQQAGCVWYQWGEGDQRLLENLNNADVIVDALLGTGIKGQLREGYLAAITAINHSQRPVLALDIPSGLYADTGVIADICVDSDITITFVAYKRGQMTLDGPDYCGHLVLADLGLSEYPDLFEQPLPGSQVTLLNRQQVLASWPARRSNSHKKTYGHVVVIAGNVGMAGAGLLAARAALKSGAGLVTLVTHRQHAASLHSANPELMIIGIDQAESVADALFESADSVVIGPGLGQGRWSEWCWQMLEQFLSQRKTSLPVVVDADGLFYLSKHPLKNGKRVLTPHPGEAGQLLAVSNQQIQQDRFASADQLAQRYQAIVVLKGNGSVIASPDQSLALSAYGNPGMATAGMGDVLAGICGSALAQQSFEAFEQVCHAVMLHGLAGNAAAGNSQASLIAGDVINALGKILP